MDYKDEKIKLMKKVELYEKIILSLEEWKPGNEVLDFVKKELAISSSMTESQKDNLIELSKQSIKSWQNQTLDEYKLYLSEIIKQEKIKFASNNLVLAPVGSGKTTFVRSLVKKQDKKSLMLVSNTTLKDSISPNNEARKVNLGERTYTTQSTSKHGEGNHEVYVMSYAEFGKKVEPNNNFIKDFSLIICDEIHSLPNYQQFSSSVELAHAIKTLFNKHEGIQIFYLTATDEYINKLKVRQPELLSDVTTFDFRHRKDIKQYISLVEYKIKNLDQIRPHLKARLAGFNYFGHKVLAFSRTINEQKKMEAVAIEEGYKPLLLWSVNNEKFPMDEDQLEAREYLIEYGEIPSPYNFLIINSAMQEGWNLKDKLVKLAIMNTTSETEKVQALGRLRKDVEVLIYRVGEKDNADLYIDLPMKYYNVPLTSQMKDELASELSLYTKRETLMKWASIKKLLIKQSYTVDEGYLSIDSKQHRVSTIYAEV